MWGIARNEVEFMITLLFDEEAELVTRKLDWDRFRKAGVLARCFNSQAGRPKMSR